MNNSVRRLIVHTALTDGTPVCLRTIRPSDEERIRAGIVDMSDRSRYLRFFSAFREPPPAIVKRLSAVDGHDHIGWGAIHDDDDAFPAIGAAHAIRIANSSGRAELAVALLDDFHGLGLARMLVAAVLAECANEAVNVLEMSMISENASAARLVKSLGANRAPTVDTVDRYELDVATALTALRDPGQPPGVREVLSALL